MKNVEEKMLIFFFGEVKIKRQKMLCCKLWIILKS